MSDINRSPMFGGPFIPPDVQAARPQFISGMSSALRLDSTQSKVLAEVDPRLWVSWSVSVLGGDEYTTNPYMEAIESGAPEASWALLGEQTEFGGRPYLDYRQGILAKKIGQLYIKRNVDARTRLQRVGELSARFTSVLLGGISPQSEVYQQLMPAYPHTSLTPDKTGRVHIVIGGDTDKEVAVDRPLNSVVTYGPGLTGAIFAANMAGRISDITFVSGGMGADFVNSWIAIQSQVMDATIIARRRSGNLQQYLKPGVDLAKMRMPQTRYFNGGIADAAVTLASNGRLRGGRTDMVLMSSVHSAGPVECLAGVECAEAVLAAGGLFVVRGPQVSLAGEAGMDIVMPRARELFGTPIEAGYAGYQSQNVDSSLPEMRAADFAVFQKQ